MLPGITEIQERQAKLAPALASASASALASLASSDAELRATLYPLDLLHTRYVPINTPQNCCRIQCQFCLGEFINPTPCGYCLFQTFMGGVKCWCPSYGVRFRGRSLQFFIPATFDFCAGLRLVAKLF